MKTVTFRLPDDLVAEIEREARASGTSKSDVIRKRLTKKAKGPRRVTVYDLAKDLIGSVNDPTLPSDFSERKKHYLTKWGYGKRSDRR